MWLWPASDRPAEPDQQAAWLYDCWERIDQWVEAQGTEP